MIVCSCNVISDHDIRGVVSTGEELCSAAQVYDCLGCTVRCGLCSHSVKRILEERRPELRAAGVMKNGGQIRLVVNRIHDGQLLAGKIRWAWEEILEDVGLGDDVVRHSRATPPRPGSCKPASI